MGHRTNRSANRRANPEFRRPGGPTSDPAAAPGAVPRRRTASRPNRWLPALAAVLEVVWIGFLVAMALRP